MKRTLEETTTGHEEPEDTENSFEAWFRREHVLRKGGADKSAAFVRFVNQKLPVLAPKREKPETRTEDDRPLRAGHRPEEYEYDPDEPVLQGSVEVKSYSQKEIQLWIEDPFSSIVLAPSFRNFRERLSKLRVPLHQEQSIFKNVELRFALDVEEVTPTGAPVRHTITAAKLIEAFTTDGQELFPTLQLEVPMGSRKVVIGSPNLTIFSCRCVATLILGTRDAVLEHFTAKELEAQRALEETVLRPVGLVRNEPDALLAMLEKGFRHQTRQAIPVELYADEETKKKIKALGDARTRTVRQAIERQKTREIFLSKLVEEKQVLGGRLPAFGPEPLLDEFAEYQERNRMRAAAVNETHRQIDQRERDKLRLLQEAETTGRKPDPSWALLTEDELRAEKEAVRQKIWDADLLQGVIEKYQRIAARNPKDDTAFAEEIAELEQAKAEIFQDAGFVKWVNPTGQSVINVTEQKPSKPLTNEGAIQVLGADARKKAPLQAMTREAFNLQAAAYVIVANQMSQSIWRFPALFRPQEGGDRAEQAEDMQRAFISEWSEELFTLLNPAWAKNRKPFTIDEADIPSFSLLDLLDLTDVESAAHQKSVRAFLQLVGRPALDPNGKPIVQTVPRGLVGHALLFGMDGFGLLFLRTKEEQAPPVPVYVWQYFEVPPSSGLERFALWELQIAIWKWLAAVAFEWKEVPKEEKLPPKILLKKERDTVLWTERDDFLEEREAPLNETENRLEEEQPPLDETEEQLEDEDQPPLNESEEQFENEDQFDWSGLEKIEVASSSDWEPPENEPPPPLTEIKLPPPKNQKWPFLKQPYEVGEAPVDETDDELELPSEETMEAEKERTSVLFSPGWSGFEKKINTVKRVLLHPISNHRWTPQWLKRQSNALKNFVALSKRRPGHVPVSILTVPKRVTDYGTFFDAQEAPRAIQMCLRTRLVKAEKEQVPRNRFSVGKLQKIGISAKEIHLYNSMLLADVSSSAALHWLRTASPAVITELDEETLLELTLDVALSGKTFCIERFRRLVRKGQFPLPLIIFFALEALDQFKRRAYPELVAGLRTRLQRLYGESGELVAEWVAREHLVAPKTAHAQLQHFCRWVWQEVLRSRYRSLSEKGHAWPGFTEQEAVNQTAALLFGIPIIETLFSGLFFGSPRRLREGGARKQLSAMLHLLRDRAIKSSVRLKKAAALATEKTFDGYLYGKNASVFVCQIPLFYELEAQIHQVKENEAWALMVSLFGLESDGTQTKNLLPDEKENPLFGYTGGRHSLLIPKPTDRFPFLGTFIPTENSAIVARGRQEENQMYVILLTLFFRKFPVEGEEEGRLCFNVQFEEFAVEQKIASEVRRVRQTEAAEMLKVPEADTPPVVSGPTFTVVQRAFCSLLRNLLRLFVNQAPSIAASLCELLLYDALTGCYGFFSTQVKQNAPFRPADKWTKSQRAKAPAPEDKSAVLEAEISYWVNVQRFLQHASMQDVAAEALDFYSRLRRYRIGSGTAEESDLVTHFLQTGATQTVERLRHTAGRRVRASVEETAEEEQRIQASVAADVQSFIYGAKGLLHLFSLLVGVVRSWNLGRSPSDILADFAILAKHVYQAVTEEPLHKYAGIFIMKQLTPESLAQKKDLSDPYAWICPFVPPLLTYDAHSHKFSPKAEILAGQMSLLTLSDFIAQSVQNAIVEVLPLLAVTGGEKNWEVTADALVGAEQRLLHFTAGLTKQSQPSPNWYSNDNPSFGQFLSNLQSLNAGTIQLTDRRVFDWADACITRAGRLVEENAPILTIAACFRFGDLYALCSGAIPVQPDNGNVWRCQMASNEERRLDQLVVALFDTRATQGFERSFSISSLPLLLNFTSRIEEKTGRKGQGFEPTIFEGISGIAPLFEVNLDSKEETQHLSEYQIDQGRKILAALREPPDSSVAVVQLLEEPAPKSLSEEQRIRLMKHVFETRLVPRIQSKEKFNQKAMERLYCDKIRLARNAMSALQKDSVRVVRLVQVVHVETIFVLTEAPLLTQINFGRYDTTAEVDGLKQAASEDVQNASHGLLCLWMFGAVGADQEPAMQQLTAHFLSLGIIPSALTSPMEKLQDYLASPPEKAMLRLVTSWLAKGESNTLLMETFFLLCFVPPRFLYQFDEEAIIRNRWTLDGATRAFATDIENEIKDLRASFLPAQADALQGIVETLLGLASRDENEQKQAIGDTELFLQQRQLLNLFLACAIEWIGRHSTYAFLITNDLKREKIDAWTQILLVLLYGAHLRQLLREKVIVPWNRRQLQVLMGSGPDSAELNRSLQEARFWMDKILSRETGNRLAQEQKQAFRAMIRSAQTDRLVSLINELLGRFPIEIFDFMNGEKNGTQRRRRLLENLFEPAQERKAEVRKAVEADALFCIAVYVQATQEGLPKEMRALGIHRVFSLYMRMRATNTQDTEEMLKEVLTSKSETKLRDLEARTQDSRATQVYGQALAVYDHFTPTPSFIGAAAAEFVRAFPAPLVNYRTLYSGEYLATTGLLLRGPQNRINEIFRTKIHAWLLGQFTSGVTRKGRVKRLPYPFIDEIVESLTELQPALEGKQREDVLNQALLLADVSLALARLQSFYDKQSATVEEAVRQIESGRVLAPKWQEKDESGQALLKACVWICAHKELAVLLREPSGPGWNE